MAFTVDSPLLEIDIVETAGLARNREPLTFGVPFPRGSLTAASGLHVMDEGEAVSTAMTPLAIWGDGSIKWLLFDLQISMPANARKRLAILSNLSGSPSKVSTDQLSAGLELTDASADIMIRFGDVEFHLDPNFLLPFSRITKAGRPQLLRGSSISLTGEKGDTLHPRIDKYWVDQRNLLRSVLNFKGQFTSGSVLYPLRFMSRVHFFAGKPTVRIDFTVWNPQAAQHPGGVWDLGDSGSILFRDLSLELGLSKNGRDKGCIYSLEPGGLGQSTPDNLLIYQESSGGENWQSHNHVNKDGKLPMTFPGYKVYCGEPILHEGLRVSPCVAVPAGEGFIAAGVKHFWENFPKTIEYCDGKLIIGLFPKYSGELFELQGGEQKTHTIYLHVGQGAPDPNCLDWIHHPLTPLLPPQWCFTSQASPRPVPVELASSDEYFLEYQRLIDAAIKGEKSFFVRREIIDEYGWRNFGDLYADHEAVFHTGNQEFVSHYNNQYDVIKGALVQFMRTGEVSWFRLAGELAGHVADIDIYHTDEDRWQFNHGLFWHTDHHMDAATCTHRTSSCKHREVKDPRFVGGGPAHEHNYATGLLYYYWLTGEIPFKESVLELAKFIVRGLEGPDTIFETGVLATKQVIQYLRKLLNRASPTAPAVYELDGPGRASGNALNTLLDAYLATEDKSYLKWAEALISCCVSPKDNIASRDLLNAEYRWFYNIFLQALGRYLDVKRTYGNVDEHFWYARSVLLKYAVWMLDNEYPYLEKPQILEFPNETWAAQDIRKSDVLAHAAFYAPEPLRRVLLVKSRHFFEMCIDQLRNFATRDLTRPIVILMSNGMVHMDVFTTSDFPEDVASKSIDYGLSSKLPPKRNPMQTYASHLLKVIRNTNLNKEIQSVKLRMQL
jgi:hypothetical protein